MVITSHALIYFGLYLFFIVFLIPTVAFFPVTSSLRYFDLMDSFNIKVFEKHHIDVTEKVYRLEDLFTWLSLIALSQQGFVLIKWVVAQLM